MLVQVSTQVLIFVQISPGIHSRNRDKGRETVYN